MANSLVILAVLLLAWSFPASSEMTIPMSVPGITPTYSYDRAGSAAELCNAYMAYQATNFGRTYLSDPYDFGPAVTLSSPASGVVCKLKDNRAGQSATVFQVTYSGAGNRCGSSGGFSTLPTAACTSCTGGYVIQSGVCIAPAPGCGDLSTVVATGSLSGIGSASPTCINGCSVTAVPGTNDNGGVISVSFDNGSTFAASGVGSPTAQWKRSGFACSNSGTANNEVTVASSGNVVVLGGSRGAQCGTFNGEYYCAGASPPPGGGCVTTAGGQAFCSSSAAAPPAPKNPTTGEKAAPDTAVAIAGGAGGSQTINHYNYTTVINGNTTGGTSGGSSGGTSGGMTTGGVGGSTSGGTSGGTTGGTGTISGGGDCETAPTCDGDPIACFTAERAWETSCANRIPTVEAADAAINSGLGVADNNASIVPQAGTFNVGSFFNPASAVTECPDDIILTLRVFGPVTIPVSKWCDFLHVIGLLVLASAALQASRVLIGAIS